MAFLQQELRILGQKPVRRTFFMVNEVVENMAAHRERYVFLSHSNQDSDLARGFVNQAHDLGVNVYFDLYDSSLTLPPSADTAKRLKNRIRNAAHFILLATRNSIVMSRWCPWELGCADGFHIPISIAQTKDDSGNEWGAEYLQLYHSVDVRIDPSYRRRMARMLPRRKSDTTSVFEKWCDTVSLSEGIR